MVLFPDAISEAVLLSTVFNAVLLGSKAPQLLKLRDVGKQKAELAAELERKTAALKSVEERRGSMVEERRGSTSVNDEPALVTATSSDETEELRVAREELRENARKNEDMARELRENATKIEDMARELREKDRKMDDMARELREKNAVIDAK